jgi:hypothetical protein
MLHTLTHAAPVLLTLLAAATPVELGGLKSEAPAAWKDVPASSSMRLKQFNVPGKDGDAELVIFFFGQGQGGDTSANIDRWKKQFTPPAGKTLDDVSKVSPIKLAAKNAKATMIDVTGTYMFKAAPMAPGPGEPRPGWRMLAVVLETEKGNYYLKLTGPAKTVEAARKPFEGFVRAFK